MSDFFHYMADRLRCASRAEVKKALYLYAYGNDEKLRSLFNASGNSVNLGEAGLLSAARAENDLLIAHSAADKPGA